MLALRRGTSSVGTPLIPSLVSDKHLQAISRIPSPGSAAIPGDHLLHRLQIGTMQSVMITPRYQEEMER
jgi:hypothetical protein